MKFDSSTLFVNTGRKPLPAMQKRKKNNKNTIALAVCIAIIAVLCVFVGLIANLWIRYNEEVDPAPKTGVTETVAKEKVKTEKKTEETPVQKTEKDTSEKKEEAKKKAEKKKASQNPTMGQTSDISQAADKAFEEFDGNYSYGIVDLSDDYTYINNTNKIYNSAALGAFLMDYASNAIYLGRFDYGTDVMGHAGRDLMTSAFSTGSVDAANLLIEHFGTDALNAYFESKGYANTKFGGTIGSEGECYTTSEDLIKLMKKMNDNTTFFPYSDMYSKMISNTVDNKIAYALPEGSSLANISFESGDETFDAAVVNTGTGRFIFVAMADGGDVAEANNAIATAAQQIASVINSAE